MLTKHMVLDGWDMCGRGCEAGLTCSVDAEPTDNFLPLKDGMNDTDLLSVGESIFNIVNTMVGSGALSIPYAFRLSGYASVLLLLVVVTVTSFTAGLLGEALDLASARTEAAEVPRQHRDYGFLAEVAFGKRGRAFVGAVTVLELWLALVTLLVMNGVNAQLLFGMDPQVSIVFCTFAAALMVRIPMRAYAYISLVSLFVLLGATSAFAFYLLTMPQWVYPPVGSSSAEPGNIWRSIGIMFFCFAGHPCFPSVHESMRETHRWHKSVGVSFTVSLGYYGMLGLFAYFALGAELQPSFVMNMTGWDAKYVATALLFFLKVQLTVPLMLRAIFIGAQLEGAEGLPRGLAGRALVLALTAASACLLAGDLAALAALCGSLLVMMTSVLIPMALYLRLSALVSAPGDCQADPKGLACLAVGAFACCSGAAGTYFAVADMAAAHGRA